LISELKALKGLGLYEGRLTGPTDASNHSNRTLTQHDKHDNSNKEEVKSNKVDDVDIKSSNSYKKLLSRLHTLRENQQGYFYHYYIIQFFYIFYKFINKLIL
jgi:hypothetical protein